MDEKMFDQWRRINIELLTIWNTLRYMCLWMRSTYDLQRMRRMSRIAPLPKNCGLE